MNILFCSDPLNCKKVDSEWAHEYRLAKQHNMNIILIDYDAYKNSGLAKEIRVSEKPEVMQSILYRGWMIPVELYKKLYLDLLDMNFCLINSPEEYEHCYYLPRSYELIKDKTPLSVVYPQSTLPDDIKLSELLSPFKNNAIIIKDFVKSQKHYWNEACFIPDASDLMHVKKVVNTFLEKQGDNFQGGLVFREFVELAPVGVHPKSQMPLTAEYRIFVLNKKPITCTEYWIEVDYDNDERVNLENFEETFAQVRSNFFTVDIAKMKNGEWIIMELGDGQVAEYLGEVGLDQFYEALSKVV